MSSKTTKKVEKKSKMELKNILSYLRALYQVYQHMHWESHGKNFYGDHLLYERFYNDVFSEIDGVAEKAMGKDINIPMLNPTEDSKMTDEFLNKMMVKEFISNNFPEIAMSAEKELLSMISSMKDMSGGTEDTLQGIQSKHEEHLYLLQQRAKSASTVEILKKVANSLDSQGYFDVAEEIDQVIIEIIK